MSKRILFLILVLMGGISTIAHAQDLSRPWQGIYHARSMIYHSAQKPGFTCWVGAWLMPNGNLMVSFTEANGPAKDRPKTPPEIRKRLSWPPNDSYDMNGLELQNVHLSSEDGGKTWKKISGDKFRSPMNYTTGNGETALRDGTVVRAVWGFYLPFDDVPPTGFVQRSSDRTVNWSKPIVLLDPEKYATFPVRLRQLKDGRLLLLGGVSRAPATGALTRNDHWPLLEPLMMISEDGGQHWQGPLDVIPENYRKGWCGEEYDAAELPNGDLLCVFRREPGTGSLLWQALLKKEGSAWKADQIGPSTLPPGGGHPELLQTKEGVVLHMSIKGVHWTADAGKSWQQLNVNATGYYPRSLQTADGKIYAFGHVGSDDGYGVGDQSIVMDTFQLAPQ